MKVALHNLGCKVNAYELDVMQQSLEENGYEIVPFSESADVYIINTCTVTNIADRKSRQMLHRAKKMNPAAIVVAVGCYVQAVPVQALEDIGADLIIGNNKKGQLVDLLNNYIKENNSRYESNIIDINKSNEYEELHLKAISGHTRAYIKIQDGCNQFCSYCIIPYARGRVRSRKLEDIVDEVSRVVDSGTKEIVLTGIHLSSYGIDFKAENVSLLDVILKLNQIEGLKRIRLGSLEPRIITEEFVAALSKLEKFCPHFHLSLQSGCDETLKRMNRRYDSDEYYEKCCLIRQYFKTPAITTDVIVGFPGETDEEFEASKAFLKKINFYEMHIFRYSKREGTKAAAMENQVPDTLKTKRSNILLSLEKEMSLEFREQFINTVTEVLLEEPVIINNKKYIVGHTKEYVKVALDDDTLKFNQIIGGKITGKLNDNVLFMEKHLKN